MFLRASKETNEPRSSPSSEKLISFIKLISLLQPNAEDIGRIHFCSTAVPKRLTLLSLTNPCCRRFPQGKLFSALADAQWFAQSYRPLADFRGYLYPTRQIHDPATL